mgnify:FL=1
MNKELSNLAREIEAAFELSENLTERARNALKETLRTPPTVSDFHSTDRVLKMVQECLPGWAIHIKGTATSPNGHWHCSLRKSEIRDNDSYVGIGQGPTLPHAVLAAVIGALAQSQ